MVGGLTWLSQQYELSNLINKMTDFIGIGMSFAVGPVLGVAWGGRARTPWRAFFLSMVAAAFAVTFAVTFAAAYAAAYAGRIAIDTAIAFAGIFAFAIAGAEAIVVAVVFAVALAFP